MSILNRENLKQYLLLSLIVVLTITIGKQLYTFFPGLLGAITLYILLRQYYFKLTVIRNWKKWLTAVLFIIGSIIVFALPLGFLIQVLIPRLTALLSNGQLSSIIGTLTDKLHNLFPQLQIDQSHILNIAQKITTSAPIVLGETANMFANAILAFFLLYFMLVDGRKMEYTIMKYIPLRDKNIDNLWRETRVVVIASAIGIPLLAFCQTITAALGYYFFGINSYLLWAVLTGVCSLVPVVGTAVVWIPLSVYLIASGHTPQGLGLAVYSFLVTGTIDNVLRFTLLKKLGDVHPVITALGILVGVPLFGFMGFIFGPLLISYLLLLIKIYRIEFSAADEHTP